MTVTVGCALERTRTFAHRKLKVRSGAHPTFSIQNRFAYLDPLNHLQVELIHRHRALSRQPGDEDPRVHRGIHLSINGVAAGLRNTG